MRQLIERAAMLAGLALIVTLPGAADMPSGTISAFNQAVQSGDPATIVTAAKQMGATAVAHPEDPQAPVAAFEAANQLCLRGACADAVPMAAYLSGLEDGLPVSRAEVDVLTAFANWSASAKDEAADAAFESVLSANESAPPSLLSISAFEAFYVAKTQTSEWQEISERAGLAAGHLEQARDILPDRWATAELLSATADFNNEREFRAYDRISDLEAWIRGKRGDETVRDRLAPSYFEVMAWKAATGAFFRSYDNATYTKASRHGRSKYQAQIDAAEARAEAITDQFPAGTSSQPPFCTGELVKPPRPSYPRNAARKGYIGAVIVGVDFEDGAISNVKVLAAVPDGAFEQTSLDAMKKIKWKFDAEQENPDCVRTKETAMIQSFEYLLH